MRTNRVTCRHRESPRPATGASAVRSGLTARKPGGLYVQGQNAQEAHEAIGRAARPSDPRATRLRGTVRSTDWLMRTCLPDEGRRGRLDHVNIDATPSTARRAMRRVGRTITFQGFLRPTRVVDDKTGRDDPRPASNIRGPAVAARVGDGLRPETRRPPATPSVVVASGGAEIGGPRRRLDHRHLTSRLRFKRVGAGATGWPAVTRGWRRLPEKMVNTPSPRRWRRCWNRSPGGTPSGRGAHRLLLRQRGPRGVRGSSGAGRHRRRSCPPTDRDRRPGRKPERGPGRPLRTTSRRGGRANAPTNCPDELPVELPERCQQADGGGARVGPTGDGGDRARTGR